MPELTIKPEHYTGKDIDLISDIICEILAEHHDVVVGSISFDINVSYTEDDEDALDYILNESPASVFDEMCNKSTLDTAIDVEIVETA